MPPKRRRRYHGLYYHSSPPRVLQMNGSNGAHSGKEEKSKEVFVVKPSNIRIWIHDKDLAKLTKVLWVGQGNRLRAEVSNNARVKRFLDTVPHVMNVIRDMHQAAVANDIETLQLLLAPRSIPRSLIRSRDANGLTVMHKAAGFGYTMMVEYLLEVWPDGVTEIDGTGKTPLHWAASAKNNVRCYNLLVQAGADEEALDYKMRSAAYYKQKPSEIDRSLLSVIPDAPRIPHDSHPDWSALVHDDDIDFPRVDFIKNRFDSPRESEAIENGMKINARTLSIDNTSEPDMDDGISKLSVEEEALEAAIEEEKQEEPDFDDYTQEENDFPANGGDIFSRGETPLLEDKGEKTTDKDKEESEQNNQEKEVELIKESSGVDEMDELQPENENFLQNEPEVEAVNDDEESQNENITIEKSDLNIEETNDVDLNGKTEGFDDQGHAIFGNEASENEQMEPLEDTLNILKINIEEVKEDLTDLEIGDKENDELIDIENKENSEDENTIVQSDDNEELENVENLENDGEVSSTDGGNKGSEVDLNRDTKVAEIDNDDVIEEKTVKDDVIVTIRINDQSLDPNNDAEDNDSKDGLMTNEHQEDAQIKDDDSEVNDEDKRGDTDNNDEIVVNESISRKDQEEIAEDDDQKEQSQDNVKTAINNGAETVIGNADEIDDDDQDEVAKILIKDPEKNFEGNEMNVDKAEQSPSPAFEIQGIVQGEADDNQVQSEGGNFLDDQSRVNAIIASGDMEQLAALVLNGEGGKLRGSSSPQPQIQAFLDNVPAYMTKIRRVHQAAREGNLREVQAALDRRKFAIAKDEISPNGASPLHVATIFGHAGIVRYLGGRFPETTSAVDDNGRTALHYAATINDNWHFYNLLTHLGSNPKAIDKLGNTPEFYRDPEVSQDLLSHRQLLKDFGANEKLEQEMLSDQGKSENRRIEIPLFRSEQGQYLASTLGDPLIKGLTEIVEKRPSDPVGYLADFLHNYSKTRPNQQIGSNGLNGLSNGFSGSLNQGREDIPPTTPGNSPSVEDRDEHGQSMLHFACARSQNRNALTNLIEETGVKITYRDELYRTARDVSLQASQPANARDIDRYVLTLAARGDLKAFEDMVLDGYDHILNLTDDKGNSIIEVARSRGFEELAKFLEGVQEFEERREELHHAIRNGIMDKVEDLTSAIDGDRLVMAKNYYGRTALHIAVLKENEEIIEHLTNVAPAALKIGDNLERTPIHYAMGIPGVETISRILIKKGVKRTMKDLKGRQPSYYFMNRADILRLEEEEQEDR